MEGGEEAPALGGGAFLANWNGLTVGDHFERIRTNQFPAGSRELDRQTELLKQIKFEASKPAKPDLQ
jgi:hypothetical protein